MARHAESRAAEFDAELHLRLVGERMLLDLPDRSGPPWVTPLGAAAQALVAVGAIDEQAADAVLDDYAVAVALRSPANAPARLRLAAGRRPPPTTPSTPLRPRRVVPCDRRIETAAGAVRVRYVSLTGDATRIGATFRPRASGPAGDGRRGTMPLRPSGRPPVLTVTDDHGTTAQAHFVGGGAEEWRGHFQTSTPLARDAAWLDLDGERVDLADVLAAAEVSIEQLPDESPAVRHLWRLVTTDARHLRSYAHVEPVIDALVASGALAADDPAIGETQTAREAFGHGPIGSGPGAPRLPDPWHSLLSRRSCVDGPQGTLMANAVTPEFDGISVAVTALESTADGWLVTVDVAPDTGLPHAASQSSRLRALTWWARDDVGNHYLGENGSWSGGGGAFGSGEITFWPTLDPAATVLVVLPTAETRRAVIRLPLLWDETAEPAG
jgi:hypothetical protein